jgi:hypothetical protein
MKRTDVHRPSVINPEDYEFVAVECRKILDCGDVEMVLQERSILDAHMKRTGGTYSRHAHGGNCHVCGNANAIYTMLFYHAKTNTYIRMGEDCASKVECGDTLRLRRITDAVAAAQYAYAGKLKAQGVLAELGLTRAWELTKAYGVNAELLGHEEGLISNIVGKLVSYGSISEKQVEFLRSLLQQIDTRAERMAQRKAEHDAAKPAPAGRTKVEVEVVSIKEQENDFGKRWVMTVKSIAEGWIAWGSAPYGVERGQRITLAATFAPKADDPKFAFFKRPRVVA